MVKRNWAVIALVAALGLASGARAQMSTVIGSSNGDGYPAPLAKIQPIGVAVSMGTTFVTDVARVRAMLPDGTMETVAGTGVTGCTTGPVETAKLSRPAGIAAAPGVLYVTDDTCQRIVRIMDGTVSALPVMNTPQDVAVGPNGEVYATSLNTGWLYRLDGNSWTQLAKIADENGFGQQPVAIAPAMDGSGFVYVTSIANCHVYRADSFGNVVSIAGTTCGGAINDGGPATQGGLNQPYGLAWAPGTLYVSNALQPRVRKIDLASGIITTIAGNGLVGDVDNANPLQAQFMMPKRIVRNGSRLLVADANARKVKAVELGPLLPTPLATATAPPPTSTRAPTFTATVTRTATKTNTPMPTATATVRDCADGEEPSCRKRGEG